MKIHSKKSDYCISKKDYWCSGIVKCSGFYAFWCIEITAHWTGTSFFVIAHYRHCDKNSKDLYSNVEIGIAIRKHCNTASEAKRVMTFLYDYPMDYVENININKSSKSVSKEG